MGVTMVCRARRTASSYRAAGGRQLQMTQASARVGAASVACRRMRTATASRMSTLVAARGGRGVQGMSRATTCVLPGRGNAEGATGSPSRRGAYADGSMIGNGVCRGKAPAYVCQHAGGPCALLCGDSRISLVRPPVPCRRIRRFSLETDRIDERKRARDDHRDNRQTAPIGRVSPTGQHRQADGVRQLRAIGAIRHPSLAGTGARNAR